ncbi:MAG: biopolymer transporter ExbD [Flavobacteriaceae bacterium]|jgi:biopolymer transport protein ExbD|nr:biopolymer transporter ExbD [Flavobacteriaceae bacterium]
MSAGVDTSSGNDKKGKKVRSKKMSVNVDMAPMCDLGFLLITFFMFTTTFSKPNIMKLNMPPKLSAEELAKLPEQDVKQSNSLTIVIGSKDKIYWHQELEETLTSNNLNETNYSKEGLRKEILTAQKRALDPKMFTVLIKPTDSSNYRNLVDVLDEMAITKSERYGIVKITPWEKKVYDEKTVNVK